MTVSSRTGPTGGRVLDAPIADSVVDPVVVGGIELRAWARSWPGATTCTRHSPSALTCSSSSKTGSS